MPQKMKAKLIGVHGDQEEFSYLIGYEGDLRLASDSGAFSVGGDCVQFDVRATDREGMKVKISTKRGNLFTFRIVPVAELRRRLHDVIRQSQADLEALKDLSD